MFGKAGDGRGWPGKAGDGRGRPGKAGDGRGWPMKAGEGRGWPEKAGDAWGWPMVSWSPRRIGPVEPRMIDCYYKIIKKDLCFRYYMHSTALIFSANKNIV